MAKFCEHFELNGTIRYPFFVPSRIDAAEKKVWKLKLIKKPRDTSKLEGDILYLR